MFIPWWRQEIGGLPVWGLIVTLLALGALATIVILNLA